MKFPACTALKATLCFLAIGLSTAFPKDPPQLVLAPRLGSPFGDNAVFQQQKPVPLWGWTLPGAEVVVTFDQQKISTTAGAAGRWEVTLDAMPADKLESVEVAPAGRTLTVVARAGGKEETKVFSNILIGDVWLCSGQSNMEMGITLCSEDEEIARADFPNLRLLTVEHQTAFEPKETVAGEWKRCSPEALREGGWGGFSATAYFFGKTLQQELKVPIGLIHSSWGGTLAEGWASASALEAFPEFKPQLDEVAAIAASTVEDPDAAYLDAWFQKSDPGTAKGWHRADTDTSTWRGATLPGNWRDCGIPGFEGVVWVQRQFELPTAWAGQALVVHLGEISDSDTTWLNGTVIGRTHHFGVPRRYEIPAGIAKAGTNTLTLRITNAGGGGVLAEKHPLNIYPAGDEKAAIPLAGKWHVKETSHKNDTGRPLVGNPRVTSVLYNGMIAPLIPCSMKGVIWYQGEANASQAHQYRKLLPALIQDWRQRFHSDDLPFHIVSLANFEKAHDQPRDDAWAELREAQAMTAKNVPYCGLAVTVDIGEAADIHPKNKREVGRRLALNALAETYGQDVTGSGPWFRSAEIENGRIRIHFDSIDGGLRFKGATDRSFAIAGKDRRFFWAKAEIDGENVIVSSPEAPEPVAVRYAWDSNPQACLYNEAGLPAVPFRSDNWHGITEKR